MRIDEYLEEFRKKLNKYRETKADTDREAVIDLQYEYMEDIRNSLLINAIGHDKEPVDVAIYTIISSLIDISTSGNVIEYVDTEEVAYKVRDALIEWYDDMLLETPQIEKISEHTWSVDCMFGGAFCPVWDGLDEEG